MPSSTGQFLLAAITIAAILPGISTAQSDRPTMKAMVVHEYGGPEVLKFEDVSRPEPKENEILVRVIAAGPNPGGEAAPSAKIPHVLPTHTPPTPRLPIARGGTKKVAEIAK